MDPGEKWTRRLYSPAHPLQDENLLQEILLRLPPRPSHVRRASLACKRWRQTLSDPRFLRRFRKHHWKLLGFFYQDSADAPGFTPMLDRVPAARFGLALTADNNAPFFLGCRHGLALLLDHPRREAVLWNPVTGGQRRVALPQGVGNNPHQICGQSAAVLCSAADDQCHIHDGDHCLSTFKLVVVWQDSVHNPTKSFACVYESGSDAWGDVISMTTTHAIANAARPSVMVGSALYWLLSRANILEFHLQRQTLAVIEKPADVAGHDAHISFQVLRREEDNGLGLAIVSSQPQAIQLWARESNRDGVVSWMLRKNVQLDEFLSRLPGEQKMVFVTGYDDDTNVIFLSSFSHDFMLQIESMQFGYIGKREFSTPKTYYPYTDFYTTVKDIAG